MLECGFREVGRFIGSDHVRSETVGQKRDANGGCSRAKGRVIHDQPSYMVELPNDQCNALLDDLDPG